MLRDESFSRLESVILELAGFGSPESVISELAGFGSVSLRPRSGRMAISYRSRRCSFVQEHHWLLALVNVSALNWPLFPRSRLAGFG